MENYKKRGYKDPAKYAKMRRRENNRYYGAREYGQRNKKRSWTFEEIRAVMEHDTTDTEIAQRIKRSVRAVQIMRNRQNKIRAEQDG